MGKSWWIIKSDIFVLFSLQSLDKTFLTTPVLFNYKMDLCVFYLTGKPWRLHLIDFCLKPFCKYLTVVFFVYEIKKKTTHKDKINLFINIQARDFSFYTWVYKKKKPWKKINNIRLSLVHLQNLYNWVTIYLDYKLIIMIDCFY